MLAEVNINDMSRLMGGEHQPKVVAVPPTECLSRRSSTVLNLLAMYASTSSLTCGSYSTYIEKDSLPNNCDLIAARERLASAQRVPAIPISPGAMSYSTLRMDKGHGYTGGSYLSDPVPKFLNRSQLQEEISCLLIVSLSKVGKGACKIKFCLPFGPFLRFLGWPRAWNHRGCSC